MRQFTRMLFLLVAVAAFAGPQTLTAQKTIVYAALYDEGNLAVVDPVAGILVQRIQVGRNPDYVVTNADNSKIYVSNAGDVTVSIVSVADAKVTQVLRLPVNRRNIWAGPMTRTPDGSRIFVAERAENNEPLRVYAIDTKKELIVSQCDAGKNISAVSVSNDGKKLFVVNKGEGIQVFDAESFQPLGKVQALKGMEADIIGLACSPTSPKAYATYGPRNVVQVINTETMKSDGQITIPKYNTGIQLDVAFGADGHLAFIVNHKSTLKEVNGVNVIDASKNEVIKLFNSGVVQRGIMTTADSKICYIAAEDLKWYDTATLAHIRSISLRTPIHGIAVIRK